MSRIDIVRPVGSGLLIGPSDPRTETVTESATGSLSVSDALVGGDYPNEPEGFTTFAEYDCSDVGDTVANAVRSGSWSTLSFVDPANVPTVITDAGLGHSDSPDAIRAVIPDGQVAGTGIWHGLGWDVAGFNGEQPYDEIYRSVWVRINSPIEKPSTKVIRLWMLGNSNKQNGSSNHASNNVVSVGDPVTEFFLHQSLAVVKSDGTLGSGHQHVPNIDASLLIKVDQWHHVEGWYLANTVDEVNDETNPDGAYKVWIDGTLVHHRTGIGGPDYDDPAFPGSTVAFRGWADTRSFWQHRGHMIWSQAGQNDKVGDSDIDIGHIYYSHG